MKLMPYVYQVAGVSLSHGYDATAYLIEGTKGLYLIDCGTPDGFEAIADNIRRLQFAPEDIRAVYGTHGHYDHVGAAALFKEKYGCRLYLHEAQPTSRPVQWTADSRRATHSRLETGYLWRCCTRRDIRRGACALRWTATATLFWLRAIRYGADLAAGSGRMSCGGGKALRS